MDQHQFLDVIDRDEAERRFRAALRLAPLGRETISIDEALGRVLADDVRSPVDVPSFDRSNFDGFAIRAVDSSEAREERPRTLGLVGDEVATAVVPNVTVDNGQAMAIATGGVLPRGADAVVMVEDTEVSAAGELLVRRPVAAGFGITYAGTDIAVGETVLRRGDRMTSRETGVLAAMGVAEVAVWRRPRVAILSTGNEIIEPGRPMSPGLVYDSNARILADAVREAGGLARPYGIVPDDLAPLTETLDRALRSCDVVLLSGGTSKGRGDLSYRVVRDLDPGVLAHGVALKPGKPVCLAASGTRPVVILPGFPTSAIFTFHEFVAPVIRALAGLPAATHSTMSAQLAVKVNSEIGRTEYLLVNLVENCDLAGESWVAYPMGKGSGSVTTFSRADGFVTIDRHCERVDAGARIDVRLLGQGLRVADLVVIGSHCLGLDYLLGLLQDDGFQTKFLAVGSTAGLAAARRGQCDVAGIHLLDPDSGEYNRPYVTKGERLLAGYPRMQGLVYRAGDERFAGKDDAAAIRAAIASSDLMMVNRNQGSGTRLLIDRLLDGACPPGYASQAHNHNAVVAAVSQGRADWGIAIHAAAEMASLAFTPIAREQYDFVIPRSRVERPAVQAFCELLGRADVRQTLEKYGT